MTSRKVDPKGFTLSEVLIVIAIVAILAAVLFPVFSKARERSASGLCLGNEQRIGFALFAYAYDHDGAYPLVERDANPAEASLVPDETIPVVPWHWAVRRYIPGLDRGHYTGDFEFAGGVWSCPAFPVVEPMNYGLNDMIAGNESYYAPFSSFAGRSRSMKVWQVPNPSSVVLAGEKGYMGGSDEPNYVDPTLLTAEWDYTPDAARIQAANDKDGIASFSDPYPWPPNVFSFRHDSRSNVLLADGHVRPISIAAVSGMQAWCATLFAPNPDRPSWYPYPVNGVNCTDLNN